MWIEVFAEWLQRKNILIISPWKGINGFKELLHCTFCCLLWVIWSLEIENHLGTYRIENIYGVIKLPCNSFSFLTATATRLCLFVLAVLCRSLEPPFLYGLLGTWEMGAVIYWDANTNWKMVYKVYKNKVFTILTRSKSILVNTSTKSCETFLQFFFRVIRHTSGFSPCYPPLIMAYPLIQFPYFF